MTDYIIRNGISIASVLADFVDSRALPGTGVDPARFWAGLAKLLGDMTPRNRALLA